MSNEEIDRIRKDLEVMQQASGLTAGSPPVNFRLLGLSLAAFGLAFTCLAMWQPEWVLYSVFGILALFLGITVCLVRAGLPSFSRREMVEMFGWLGSLLAVCLIFAIWGVLVELPLRVLCGAEMFISGIFPLPVALATRDAKTWICGVPLMAAGLSLPFVTWPVGLMAGMGVVLSGICYWLAHSPKPQARNENAD